MIQHKYWTTIPIVQLGPDTLLCDYAQSATNIGKTEQRQILVQNR